LYEELGEGLIRDYLGGIEDLYFAAVFAVFTLFLILSVEGVVAKAWLVGQAAL
jgi:hypothetical protein